MTGDCDDMMCLCLFKRLYGIHIVHYFALVSILCDRLHVINTSSSIEIPTNAVLSGVRNS